MNRLSKAYVSAISLGGVACVALASRVWRPAHLAHFSLYLLFAILTSQMKVKLPRVNGTMSVLFVFVLLAAIDSNLLETIAIAAVGTLVQCLWQKRRATPVQLLFNVSSVALSASGCYAVTQFHQVFPSVPAAAELLAASLAYFLLNTLTVSGIIALSEGRSLYSTWYGGFFWTSPQYVCSACAVWILDKVQRWIGWEFFVFLLPMFYLVYYCYRLYLGQLAQEQKHVEEMSGLQLRTIKALALAIEAKDLNTHSHLRRVQVYALGLARLLRLDEPHTKALEAASMLHDIGKLAVPEYILSKPGKLTAEEFQKMKTHPVVGADILTSIGFPYPVAPIVRSHHERWDGVGYPDGLRGEEIPIGARILAVVDCLDAMASDRQYRAKVGISEALEFVSSQAGNAFDPHVVKILIENFQSLEDMAKSSAQEAAAISTEAELPNMCPVSPIVVDLSVRGNSSSFVHSIAAARQEFQMLLEVTAELGNSLSVDETFALLGSRLKSMIPHDAMAIFVRKDDVLRPLYVNGVEDWVLRKLLIPQGTGLSGWVADNGRPILNGDPAIEPGYAAGGGNQLRAGISVPLEAAAGIIGALTLYRSALDSFNPDHLRILLAISSKAALTIANALEYSKVQSSAVTDELTGLPNARSLFLELERELAHARRRNAILSILVLDLNGFKQVNDRFGHLQGNHLLAGVAQTLRSWCREYDYVARMGGDEFVVLLRDLDAEELNGRIAELHSAVIESGSAIMGERIVSLSAGHASFPIDGAAAEELLGLADKRMYQTKQVTKLARSVANPEEMTIELPDPGTSLRHSGASLNRLRQIGARINSNKPSTPAFEKL